MLRRTATATVAAMALSVGCLVGAGAAYAADPVQETGAQAYTDLQAVQTATRSGWTTGYVIHARGTTEGGWSWVDTFDPTHQTLLWQPSRGSSRLSTPTSTYVAIIRNARTRAVLALAARPQASWFDVATPKNNPDYYLMLGHEFDTYVAQVPDPPTAGGYDLVDSATVTTDLDGTRHWVVQSHFWTGGVDRPASSALVVTADPQGRLIALSTADDPLSGETVTYSPPPVPRPSVTQYIAWDTYALADATYSLRSRIVGAAGAVVRAAQGYASRHHRALRVADLRYEAPLVVRALASSVVPVRTAPVASGIELYGWNRFARSWVVYYVRVLNHRTVVTRIR